MTREEVNVLVVDDVATIRAQMKEVLKGLGFRKIFLAKSGQEAIQAVSTQEFQLILCDLHMSPVNGMEFLRYIRTESPVKNVAFIMLTADATKEQVMGAIGAGVDGYMIKPVTLPQVQAKVYGILLDRKVL